MTRSPLPLIVVCAFIVMLAAVSAMAQPALLVTDHGKRDVPFALGPRERGLMRAQVLERNQRADEALAVYGSMLVDRPGDREVLDAYVDVLLRLKRLDEAQRVLAVWVRAHPDTAEAHKRLAETFAAANKQAMAVEYYERALSLAKSKGDSKDTEALEGLAYALWGLERTTEALIRFNELAALRPGDKNVSTAIRDLCRQRRTEYVSRWTPYSTEDLCPKISLWSFGLSDDQPAKTSPAAHTPTAGSVQNVSTP